MRDDPFYRTCALAGYHGHVCEGRITWEHALYNAGKKVQKKFAIIPICARAHEVDLWQDAGTMDKALNQWVALSRATPEELRELSKAEPAERKLAYLQGIYGFWTPPQLATGSGINY